MELAFVYSEYICIRIYDNSWLGYSYSVKLKCEGLCVGRCLFAIPIFIAVCLRSSEFLQYRFPQWHLFTKTQTIYCQKYLLSHLLVNKDYIKHTKLLLLFIACFLRLVKTIQFISSFHFATFSFLINPHKCSRSC